MGVAVQVDDVRSFSVFQAEQPIARQIDIVPGILHPLQAERALGDADVWQRAHVRPLRSTQRPTHGGQDDLRPERTQRAG